MIIMEGLPQRADFHGMYQVSSRRLRRMNLMDAMLSGHSVKQIMVFGEFILWQGHIHGV